MVNIFFFFGTASDMGEENVPSAACLSTFVIGISPLGFMYK